MPFAKVNEIDLFYETVGSKNPVLFLSGFSTHHLTWTPFIEPFQKEFQLILPDHRGAGQSSSPPPPYTIETLARDAIALLDHLEVKKAHMVGSSMGTAIVQTISHLFPNRIDKGALIAPFPKLPEASLLKSEVTGKLLQAGAPMELVIETVIPWLFSRDFVSHPSKVIQKIEEMCKNPYPQPIEGFLGQIAALKAFDSSSFISTLDTDFLLLAGEEDLSTPLSCAEFLHKHLPSSTLHTFPRVGHMIHAERQEDVIHLIKEFFLS